MDELTGLAAVALLIGLLCAWLGPGRLAWIGMLLAALAAGWLLSGAPRHPAALRASWPIGLGVAVAVLLFARALAGRALDPLRLALAGLTLAAALHVAGAPPIWTQLALVPGLAALAMFALPPMPGLAALPVAVDVAALGCLAVISLGRHAPAGVRAGRCRRAVAVAGGLAPAAHRGAAAPAWPSGAAGRLPAGGRDRGRLRLARAAGLIARLAARTSGSVSPISSINSRYGARSSAKRVISVIRPAAVIGSSIRVAVSSHTRWSARSATCQSGGVDLSSQRSSAKLRGRSVSSGVLAELRTRASVT